MTRKIIDFAAILSLLALLATTAHAQQTVNGQPVVPASQITGTLPVSHGGTGITSFGTGIATALGVNVGTAGAPVVNGGALGTPSSGVGTNITGVNAATLGGATFAAPGTIGGGTPGNGNFTGVTVAGSPTTQITSASTGRTNNWNIQSAFTTPGDNQCINFGFQTNSTSYAAVCAIYPQAGSGAQSALVFKTSSDDGAMVERFRIGGQTATGTGSLVQLAALTVSTLPTCNSANTGALAYVTDATSPTYNATLTGSGAIRALAMCNGTNWTAH